jgi:hypothetical protein
MNQMVDQAGRTGRVEGAFRSWRIRPDQPRPQKVPHAGADRLFRDLIVMAEHVKGLSDDQIRHENNPSLGICRVDPLSPSSELIFR